MAISSKDIESHASKIANAKKQDTARREIEKLRGAKKKKFAQMSRAEKDEMLRALLLKSGLIEE